MKTTIFILFLLCRGFLSAQDQIYLTNGGILEGKVKEISPDNVTYKLNTAKDTGLYIIRRHHIAVIVFASGIRDTLNSPLGYGKNDPFRINKNAFRYYFTDLYYNKLSVGFERVLTKRFSIEINGFYKFIPNPYKYNTEDRWENAVYYHSKGGEMNAGISRHYYTAKGRSSYGAALSYRQQSFNDITVEENRIGHPDKGIYHLSQYKKGIGLLFKYNYTFKSRKSGFEFFIIGGPYLSFTKNEVQWYRTYAGSPVKIYDPVDIPKLKSWYLKDGFACIPYFDFGFAYKICQPPKGWYKSIVRQRDSLKFARKNVILYNPIEHIDGALGITYARIFYKQAISLISQASFGYNNSSARLSNGLLAEHSLNYYLSHKNYDVSLSGNYNFSRRQQSFYFIGLQYRFAQFNGGYQGYHFILDKSYILANTGFLLRAHKGFSFLMNINFGHYYNYYQLNNPEAYMKQSGMIIPDYNINSFNFSLQFGYSF